MAVAVQGLGVGWGAAQVTGAGGEEEHRDLLRFWGGAIVQRVLSCVGIWDMAVVSLTSTTLGGVFFIQESFVLQHVAALCEWVFIIDVLVFYGTFTFEFGAISTDTFLVLLKASRAPKSHKGEDSLPGAEGLPML